jgi:N-acetylmuramoyl-L-alanine amidase
MSKVFIGVGHGGADFGAIGYLVEKDVNLNIALACRDYLVAHNIQVKMSRSKDENDPVMEEVRECNAYAPDLAIDVHSNAGGGDGFEGWYSHDGGLSKTLAENVEKETIAIGQNSRGIKSKLGDNGKDYYAFIRETNCPAIIAEGLFVDNKVDVQIADTIAEQKRFGVAYAKAILETLGITTPSDPINCLVSKGIINSPNYWRDAIAGKHNVSASNLNALLTKFAEYIRK